MDGELLPPTSVDDIKAMIARVKFPPLFAELKAGVDAMETLNTKGRTDLVPAVDKLRDALISQVRDECDRIQRALASKPR